MGGWEWSLWGKRFTAGVSCGVVSLTGWIVGSYLAGIPKIQAHLQISPQLTFMGNVFFFFGLVIPTLFFWPLPLLHGRKPYLLLSISLLLPLQLPQALSLPPYTTEPRRWEGSMKPYVICLLFFRSLSGLIIGFAFMNALATIMDLFGPDTGACCRGGVVYNNRVPLEGQNQYNAVPGGESGVRMGVWIGVFTWLLVGSPALGYLFGSITIARSTPAWGFWTVMILAGFLLALIVVAPEVRPAWKRLQITENPLIRRPRSGLTTTIPETVERGEIKLVMYGRSPQWWWEELSAGLSLTWRMLHQKGFLIVAVYFGWVFGHVLLVMILLAALITQEYNFSAINVGVAIFALFVGALFAVPTQFSVYYSTNFRHRSSMTMHNRNYGHRNAGQHPYRLWLWLGTFLLPLSSIMLTVSAMGPPVHFMIPTFLAAVVSFSSALVLAECYILMMDNFDISDLPEPLLGTGSGSISQGANSTHHPHGTQRPTSLTQSDDDNFTTSHPCLSSGLAISHTLAFLFGAIAVGVSSNIVEGMGVRNGLGVYSAVTGALTLGLVYALWRSKEVRLVEVFDEDGAERNAKISLLQRSWGSRWTEVNGMEWWEDENSV
ncbi:major facilitator superfamily domain-containing protein [Sphaerosporella brunnea]|uniref:Major facilitator superfamily domain-containing protein n=1 Tax=Sphaerosporella brunnea TaxID=1250544 RepID=A0A5J5F2N2_9PEZI|nr:major facilitator superfamily domain-containing protein [Sphaerosporella brunnea]